MCKFAIEHGDYILSMMVGVMMMKTIIGILINSGNPRPGSLI